MAVTVGRSDDGEYVVMLEGTKIVLPSTSKKTVKNNLVTFGTPEEYIEVDVGPYEVSLVRNNNKNVVVAEEDPMDETALDTRGEIYNSLETAWREAEKEKPENPSGASRKLRLKKQARRTKRNARSRKHRKSRKLTTRRR